MLKMKQAESAPDFTSVNFRNGVYQGLFSRSQELRHGFGLAYTTDSHFLIASHWRFNQANAATFVFYDHAHYMYGFWQDDMPQGFNAIRMGPILVMAFYDKGVLRSNMFVLFEQYNLAVVLSPNQTDTGSEFEEINKRQIYSDEDFDDFIKCCGWIEFEDNWKTLIKFISANMVNDVRNSQQRLKLRLINGAHYRYGFEEGLAIVFDDDYRIISAGIHKKAQLSSLGIRFIKGNVVEEGDFSVSTNIFAFNQGTRPNDKIGKLYSNCLLKGIDFVNRCIANPAKPITDYFKDLSRSNVFKLMVAGQLTNRTLQFASGNSNGSIKKVEVGSSRRNGSIRDSPQKNQLRNSQKSPIQSNEIDRRQLEEEKMRLERYKKQISGAISAKMSQVGAISAKMSPVSSPRIQQPDRSSQIIHKKAVNLVYKDSNRDREASPTRSPTGKIVNQKKSRSRSRSPIFTPDRSPPKNPSPFTASPFNDRIKSKIFKSKPTYNHRNYVYEPIMTEFEPEPNLLANYQSPHQAIELSREHREAGGSQVLPISIRNEEVKTKEFKNLTKQRKPRDQVSNEKKKEPIKKTISFGPGVNDDEFKKVGQIKERQEATQKLVKNAVYLRPTHDRSQQKQKKPMKNSYLQRYQMTKNTSPIKSPEEQFEQKKYNRVIKNFNDSNRPYELVTSPQNGSLEKRRGSPAKRQYKYFFE